MNKIIVMGLLASAMFFNLACNSDELAAGAIGAGIGIGIGSHNRNHDRWDRDHRRRDGYRRCGYYRCYDADLNVATAGSDLAQKYNITTDAGAKIEKAFDGVSTKGIASFETIGLDGSALKQLVNRQMPSDAALKSVAQSLNMSEAQSHDLVKAMITEFNTQASNVESPYWQSCMAKGTWKTGQNMSCSSVDWKGCSPQTGATLCY